MALPMVHLLAARAWAEARETGMLKNPDYYLGAIAPDAVHMREGWDRKQKRATHLNAWDDWNPERILRYWRERDTPFDIGYGVHVLTDLAWVRYYRKNYPEILDAEGKTKAQLYYADCDKVDYLLYGQVPFAREALGILDEACAPEGHPLVSRAEIEAWRRQVARFFDEGIDIVAPPQILTLSAIEKFIEDSPALMLEILGGGFGK